MFIIIIIIIIIIIVVVVVIINCKWFCTRWQWYYSTQKTQNNTYTHTQNYTQRTKLQTQ
jgi:flagellar basal body-associated protein FliL